LAAGIEQVLCVVYAPIRAREPRGRQQLMRLVGLDARVEFIDELVGEIELCGQDLAPVECLHVNVRRAARCNYRRARRYDLPARHDRFELDVPPVVGHLMAAQESLSTVSTGCRSLPTFEYSPAAS